jgi:hypothetical protein
MAPSSIRAAAECTVTRCAAGRRLPRSPAPFPRPRGNRRTRT